MGPSDNDVRREYQHLPIEFKRKVVRASLESKKSVVRLALEYGLNSNRKLPRHDDVMLLHCTVLSR